MRALAARLGDPVRFLESRLFGPLGIEDVVWDRCPNGWILAGGGLHLRTAELARIGLLIRDRGVWDGERLISAEWIDAMHTDWVRAGEQPGWTSGAAAACGAAGGMQGLRRLPGDSGGPWTIDPHAARATGEG